MFLASGKVSDEQVDEIKKELNEEYANYQDSIRSNKRCGCLPLSLWSELFDLEDTYSFERIFEDCVNLEDSSYYNIDKVFKKVEAIKFKVSNSKKIETLNNSLKWLAKEKDIDKKRRIGFAIVRMVEKKFDIKVLPAIKKATKSKKGRPYRRIGERLMHVEIKKEIGNTASEVLPEISPSRLDIAKSYLKRFLL